MTQAREQIKKEVVDALFWDARIDASDVQVEVHDGDVTLRGQVPSFLARRAAGEDASLITGVTRVDNRLTVKYPEGKAVPSDTEIQTRAEAALQWNAELDADEIKVTVRDGVVTLEGSVNAFWKKFLAEDLVQGQDGVVQVENKLTILLSQRVEDKRIAAEIVAAIDRNPLVTPEAVDVSVENGKVTLSGAVPNALARNSVFEAALYTPGVMDVESGLKIVP
jgi:osmotically-inducible protein OsmY